MRRPPRQDEAGATAVRGGPGFSPTGSRHFAKTPTYVGFSPKCVDAGQRFVVDLPRTAVTSRSRFVHTGTRSGVGRLLAGVVFLVQLLVENLDHVDDVGV